MVSKSKSLIYLVWLVCALGLFVDGYDLYIISIAEPFITKSMNLSPILVGTMQSSALFGAVFGAILIGRLADIVGRKKLLVFNFIFFVGIAILSAFAWDAWSLIAFRFLLGFAVGADYPICAAYLSEMTPDNKRAKYLASAMLMNCLAVPVGVLVAWFVFSVYPNENAWRWIIASGAIPALIALLLRGRLPESFLWSAHQKLKLKTQMVKSKVKGGYQQIFSPKFIKGTIGLCLCWFLMDMSYYGVVLFTPRIIEALDVTTTGNFLESMHTTIISTLYMSIFVVVGAALAVAFIDKIGHIRIQKIGFLAAFIGLFAMSLSSGGSHIQSMSIIFGGFIIFNLFINMGPGITTYLLPAEFYPTNIKATGHGLAAGIGKMGAFAGTLILPILQMHYGIYITVFVLSFTALLGFGCSYLISLSNKDTLEIAETDNKPLLRFA